MRIKSHELMFLNYHLARNLINPIILSPKIIACGYDQRPPNRLENDKIIFNAINNLSTLAAVEH